jgi:hypothetical protein
VEQLIPQPVRDDMQRRSDWGELLSSPLPSEPGDAIPEQESEKATDE